MSRSNTIVRGSRLFMMFASLVALFAAFGAVAVPHTFAATSVGCQSGNFTVTLPDGRVLSGNNGFKVAAKDLPANSIMKVRGRYIEFDVNVSTYAVTNYTMTGAANPQDLTGGVRTVIFASKTADLKGKTLDSGELEIQLSPESLVTKRKASGISMKIQAKDCATGGIFQVEPETGSATTFTHVLGPNLFYFTNPFTGKINFGTGVGKLIGKDSPQVATRVSQNGTTSVWSVASGGRMGGVMGEDAVEASAGASQCVQNCQAQNRIRGSLPVTDPFFNS